MQEEDDNPATNFATDGYLIGQRLNPNRAGLLQNAATLQANAATDALWPYTAEDHAPTRRAFKLPLDRPFNG